MKTRLRVLPIVAGLALGLSSCTTGGVGGSDTDGSDAIRNALNAAPTTFTPWQVANKDDFYLSRLLFNTLVRRGADNTIVPALATDWEVTPTTADFTLRDGATCADGTPITAEVVKNSLIAMATAEQSTYRDIVFGPGKPTISADDEANKVTIDLAQPWTDLLQGLSLVATGIVCPAGLEDEKGLQAGSVEGAFSGPYVLSKSSPGVSYELTLRQDFEAWPEYSDPPLQGEPAQTIQLQVMADDSSRVNALLTGALDIAAINTPDMTRFDGRDGYSSHRLPYLSLYLLFNERSGSVVAGEDVRRAVVQALSREALNNAATNGLGSEAASFAHEAVPCANTDTSLLIEQDVAAATEVLSGKTIRVLGMNVIGPEGAANSYIAEALREAGANVELANVDVATWSTTGGTKPEAWDVTLYPAINEGRTMFGAMAPIVGKSPENGGGANWSRNPHDDILAMVDEAMREPEEQARCEIYQEIQEKLIGDAHVMPLAYSPEQDTARPGFSVNEYNEQIEVSTMRIADED